MLICRYWKCSFFFNRIIVLDELRNATFRILMVRFNVLFLSL